eukprot:4219161-Prymnesium_polylepis.3
MDGVGDHRVGASLEVDAPVECGRDPALRGGGELVVDELGVEHLIELHEVVALRELPVAVTQEARHNPCAPAAAEFADQATSKRRRQRGGSDVARG